MIRECVRIRFTRIPTARDLEYFALRYIRLEGVYEVPLDMAADLIEFGCASTSGDNEPLNEFSDPVPGSDVDPW